MRVLSIDGGGIRGIIPALVLAEVEKRSGRRVFELFDLIAGTSTGGILACALCAPDPLPAQQLVAIYEEEGPSIFDRSLWQRVRSAEGLLDEKYDAAALDRALERFLADKRLAESKPDLLVPAYNMGEPGPYFFKTRKAREEGEDFPLSEVGRAPPPRRRPTSSRCRSQTTRSWTAACSPPTRRCAPSPRCSSPCR
jgi:patatin-like phospholipase/acyl hydrolase